jgi:hypothetical protein
MTGVVSDGRRLETVAAEKMKIRDATEEDLPAIVAIYNAAIRTRISTAQLEPVTVEERRNWLKQHTPNRHPFWVADIDGRVGSFSAAPPKIFGANARSSSGTTRFISSIA